MSFEQYEKKSNIKKAGRLLEGSHTYKNDYFYSAVTSVLDRGIYKIEYFSHEGEAIGGEKFSEKWDFARRVLEMGTPEKWNDFCYIKRDDEFWDII